MKSHDANMKNLLRALLDAPVFLTLDFIAESVGLSKRSVQNYLTDIDDWIIKNALPNTRVIRTRGKGVMIDADAVDRRKIERLLSKRSMSVNTDDNKRRFDIIKRLIILEEDITIKSLAEQFYASRSVIISDLEWVKEWLAAYKLELFITQRKGIVARGGEVSYRNAIAGYFDSYVSADAGEAILQNNRGRIPEKTYRSLVKIYPLDTVEKAKRIIGEAEKKFDFFLTEDYYTSLLTHIVISISRFVNGNTVPPEFIPPDDEEFPDFIEETAQYMAKRLGIVFNIIVPEMEKTYICIHLVGFNALSTERSANTEMPKNIKHLALELIKVVDSSIGTSFISDKLLFFGLCLHLKSKVFRLQKDVYYKKESGFRLPDSSMDIYNAVTGASGLFYDICGVLPDEEEMLNVACYFLLSRHRNLRKYKTLLICNKGVMERAELMDYIEKSLPSIDISDCCTTYQLKFLYAGDFDFIITTEAVELPEKPVADISVLERENYVGLITRFIEHL